MKIMSCPLLSLFFGKNFVKVRFLLKELLKTGDLTKNFFGESKFL